MKFTKKFIVMTFFFIFNIVLPWLFAFLLTIIHPKNPIDEREIQDLINLENSTPLVKLILSKERYTNENATENIYPLFGGYFLHFHTYNNCSYSFIYTCQSDIFDNKIEYCPLDKNKLNFSTCVDYLDNIGIMYQPMQNIYFYAKKKAKNILT